LSIIPWANTQNHDTPRAEEGVTLLALFHPDYTVGSGLSPDLLTLPKTWKALAGSGKIPIPPVGNCTPP